MSQAAGCCLPGLLALGLAQLPEIDPLLPVGIALSGVGIRADSSH